jgi:hypothetical protein
MKSMHSPISALISMAGKRPTYFDCEESVDSSVSENESHTLNRKFTSIELPGAESGWASDFYCYFETQSQEHLEAEENNDDE